MGELIKASSLQLGGRGALIMGAAGAGKTALTLALLERAALFGRPAALISDDYTELAAGQGALIARPPANIAGAVEIRGAGIFAVPYIAAAALHLAVELGEPGERYPGGHCWRRPGAGSGAAESEPPLPLLKLPPAGRADIAALCRAVEASLFGAPYCPDLAK